MKNKKALILGALAVVLVAAVLVVTNTDFLQGRFSRFSRFSRTTTVEKTVEGVGLGKGVVAAGDWEAVSTFDSNGTVSASNVEAYTQKLYDAILRGSALKVVVIDTTNANHLTSFACADADAGTSVDGQFYFNCYGEVSSVGGEMTSKNFGYIREVNGAIYLNYDRVQFSGTGAGNLSNGKNDSYKYSVFAQKIQTVAELAVNNASMTSQLLDGSFAEVKDNIVNGNDLRFVEVISSNQARAFDCGLAHTSLGKGEKNIFECLGLASSPTGDYLRSGMFKFEESSNNVTYKDYMFDGISMDGVVDNISTNRQFYIYNK